jgi:CRISPR system Cascade subunit CasE
MYLTRFSINRSRIALGWISNPYRVHQRLCMAYPNEERLLFRIEDNSAGSAILVQSTALPDWNKGFADFAVLRIEPETKSFDLDLVKDGLYRFRLLANPTVTRNGKRLGLLKEEDQHAWLLRQFGKAGAELLGYQLKDLGLQRAGKNPAKDSGFQTHLAVQFEGVLKAIDTERLAQAVKLGIGPAKGYGFGLLSLAIYRS